ncbi:MAG: NAD(P)-binding protein [Xanthomonadales bacterium]|nr:FAD-dependent oxidoreductase [Gammaproteobacteria bacterium]MBT8052944.1 FAD-dependent oxidoreductase [Gammaproteobacteria bacterium]NND57836.1 NAD(P)-binding protein [Xanthomonadales bacterium]NNK50715.1 NAD(P)-binding protein [Xanthomonadales bacterium]
MKIAIVGTGIAGNVAAYRLAPDHEITVFEADQRIGGHTNTVDVSAAGQQWAVDTGFIVFNDRTYPNFIALLDELGVESQDSDMSFSVRNERTGLEYNGASLNAVFAQRSNLLKPSFYRMLIDILRFNREAPGLLDDPGNTISLGDYLDRNGYSPGFVDHYIVPMGAAIWSATPGGMRAVPAAFFIRFFQNHGLLSVNDRPTWRVIKGGSRTYLDKLVAGHRDRIRLDSPVEWIRRHPEHVEVKVKGSGVECFDRVFLACHSDQALELLADPSPQEREVLGAIQYQQNEAVLHTDDTLMPKRRLAWAAWNYHVPDGPTDPDGKVALTYNMNILQSLDAPVQFCVTLNNTQAIDPDKIIQTISYSHPVFTEQAVTAQKMHRNINGPRRTYYCGAYWRYGFHEDGVVSALSALQHFQQDLSGSDQQSDEKRYLLRTG